MIVGIRHDMLLHFSDRCSVFPLQKKSAFAGDSVVPVRILVHLSCSVSLQCQRNGLGAQIFASVTALVLQIFLSLYELVPPSVLFLPELILEGFLCCTTHTVILNTL
jgi:hypothetical protein